MSCSHRGMLLTAVAIVAVCLAPAAVAQPPGAGGTGGVVRSELQDPGTAVREAELTVRTADGLGLPAVLRVPPHDDPDVGGPGRPGLVLVHGAGRGAAAAYRDEAEAFSRAGIATLTYDRRTAGYSLTERSYSQLADDALAAVELLRRQPGVDPGAVGLWGLSEGGWVAPLAASRAPDVAFLVVVGANGLSPLRQQVWAEAVRMEASGVRGSLVGAASSGTYRLIASAGLFPEAYHDPVPTLRRLTVPVLAVWGALDRSTPPVENAAVFGEALADGPGPHHSLHTFAHAQHDLRTSTDGFDRGTDFAPGYADLVTSWVHAVAAGTPPPSSATGIGDQPRPTRDVPPPPWYESAPAHGVALVVMLGGFVLTGLLAITSWWGGGARGRSSRSGGNRPAVAVAGLGATTVVGTLGYLGTLAATRGGQVFDPGPLLAGRPLPWLALQALALATVVGGIAVLARPVLGGRAADGGHGQRGGRARLVPLLAGVATFVPWSLHWGLLLP